MASYIGRVRMAEREREREWSRRVSSVDYGQVGPLDRVGAFQVASL